MSLARLVERRLGNFIARELSNTAWAFATAAQWDAALFVALASAVEWHVDDFSA